MRAITILTLATLASTHLSAQKQNNNWCLGHSGGMNFNSSPVSAFPTKTNSAAYTASVSDKNSGELLFYTDGMNVWDSSHQVMPNGTGIGPTTPYLYMTSTICGMAIAPVIGNTDQYYIFNVFTEETVATDPKTAWLAYSIVDMSLNNGKGDVLSPKKIRLGDSLVQGQLQICEGIDCDLWLVALRRGDSSTYSYHITSTGIDTTPVISKTQAFLNVFIAEHLLHKLRISPDRKKIAFSRRYRLFLADFDMASGKITNERQIDHALNYFFRSCEFSPDSKLLYSIELVGPAGYTINQYDISLPTTTQIIASAKNIIPPTTYSLVDMRLGPDGNIYVAGDIPYQSKICIHKIINPNVLYPGCAFAPCALDLIDTTSSVITFPAPSWFPVSNERVPDLLRDTSICGGDAIVLNPGRPGKYLWSTGSRDNLIKISDAGKYTVTIDKGHCSVTDSMHLGLKTPKLELGNDTALCPGTILTLAVPDTFDTYTWNTGDTDAQADIQSTGQYWLRAAKDKCYVGDTINITYPDVLFELGNDVFLCDGEVKELEVNSFPGSRYQWQDGTTSNKYTIKEAGIYTVKATNACGEFGDTIKADYENCDCKAFVPSAFTPNNDGTNEYIYPSINCNFTRYSFMIANRWGEIVFKATDPTQKWNGAYKTQPCPMDTYFYLLQLTGPRNREFIFKGDITLIR